MAVAPHQVGGYDPNLFAVDAPVPAEMFPEVGRRLRIRPDAAPDQGAVQHRRLRIPPDAGQPPAGARELREHHIHRVVDQSPVLEEDEAFPKELPVSSSGILESFHRQELPACPAWLAGHKGLHRDGPGKAPPPDAHSDRG